MLGRDMILAPTFVNTVSSKKPSMKHTEAVSSTREAIDKIGDQVNWVLPPYFEVRHIRDKNGTGVIPRTRKPSLPLC